MPTLFIAVGLALQITGFNSEQSLTFKVAAFLIMLTGFTTLLNVGGILSPLITRIIGFISLTSALILLYFAYFSVYDTIEDDKKYKMCIALSKRNLSDLRTAQEAYHDRYTSYAQDWGTIINFIETGTVDKIISEGTVPSRTITEAERDFIYKKDTVINHTMLEIEAYILSKSKICPKDLKDFKRDTIQVSFIKTTFTENSGYKKEREDNELGAFDAKALRYIPFTDNKKEWSIKTGKIAIGSDSIATIRVEGYLPFTKIKGQKTKEIVYFGKLEMSDLSGSWEEK